MDTCSTCAYDNWQSHVSERIVRPGYNDYGPATLDPQTNGFGGFTYIPADSSGDSTLARWRQVFQSAVDGDWNTADSLLMRYDSLWNYELVQFDELQPSRRYYIMRERIDSMFVDVNGDTLPENDVIGGFHRGWGVFVFNTQPRHATAVLQVPHPCDDFMAVPNGILAFQENEMSILMIAGAGREVMWDSTQSQYNNARSLSDPSRNPRHPFAVLSKVVTDEWNAPPLNPLVMIQLHSYDHGAHLSLPDIQISCYLDDSSPNPPVRDVAFHEDIFHALPVYPVRVVDGDSSIVSVINGYIGLWSNPAYTYYGEDTTIALPSVSDLIGAPDNVEAEYCHIGHSVNYHTENFIHIELDEYPDELWSPADWVRWLPGGPPTNWETYVHARDFYMPFVSALDSMLTWHEIPDETPPLLCEFYQAIDLANGNVVLNWSPSALDRHFDTYEIYYDTLDVTLASPFVTRANNRYRTLGNMFVNTATLSGLVTPVWPYQFAIRARDLAGNFSALSPAQWITDGSINYLSIFMGADSLHLNWTAQPNDSMFEIHEYPTDLGGYYLLGVTDTNTFTFQPTGYSGNGVCVLRVLRVIRR